jgi:pyruvate,water dikinase
MSGEDALEIGVRLAEVADERRFGGKTRELGAAVGAGLPVPEGLAISADGLERLVEKGEAQTSLPAGLRSLDAPYVVRSSGIEEDGEMASFAGQHRTEINVLDVDGVVEALEAVHASVRSAAALEYREKMGIDEPPRTGAVVQTLIDADVSGVLFSRNPVDGSDERVVEAAWGLGPAVVDGLVTPDRFRMRPGGEVVDRRAGDKAIRVEPDPGGGTRTQQVPEPDRERYCLDDRRLRMLERLAQQCDDYRSGGHDIEWAFGNDRCYLLQRRDITAVT